MVAGKLEAELQSMAEALIRQEGANRPRGVVLRIDAPAWKFSADIAAGEARPDTTAPMTAQTCFHLASIGKTMTAVLILQLMEDGAFGAEGIDARLAELGVFDAPVIDRLHRIDGRSHGAEITLRHMLTHQSGMKDAMVDDGGGVADANGPRPNSIVGRIMADPQGFGRKRWAAFDPHRPEAPLAGTVNYYLNTDNIAGTALFPPGEGFHYSDSAFAMLGVVAEHFGGAPLERLLAKRIFKPLGLKNTYLAYRSDPTLGANRDPEAEIYMGPAPLLTSGADISFDWGGGGQVSTAGDLNAFLVALARGALFRREETFRIMTDWAAPQGMAAPRTGVGCGFFRLDSSGGELWGHSGAWGGKMFYSPRHDVFFSGSTNQASSPRDWHEPFIQRTIETLGGGKA